MDKGNKSRVESERSYMSFLLLILQSTIVLSSIKQLLHCETICF